MDFFRRKSGKVTKVSKAEASDYAINDLPKQCLKITNETINVSLSSRFVDDVFIVIITQTTAELFVVHFWFIFTNSPSSSNLNKNKNNIKLREVLSKLHSLKIYLIRIR